MIYTSYFGNLKNIPSNIIPISICGKAPEWYKGLQYKKLAPKKDFFNRWKENGDNDCYIRCFNEQVLSCLSQKDVITELKRLCGRSVLDNPDIALICYEKPDDFCHRHLVAQWFEDGGYVCTEFPTWKVNRI